MLLFHGSKASFTTFDDQHVGSGEGAGVQIGFYFTEYPKGAAHHASSYLHHLDGIAKVYVCKLKPHARVLTRGKPITEHDPELLAFWKDQLPVAKSCTAASRNWFDQLDPSSKAGKETCSYLRNAGFHAIVDFEGDQVDGYLGGSCILVIAPAAIEIVEVLPVADILSETMGEFRQHILAESKQALCANGVLSYLRRAN